MRGSRRRGWGALLAVAVPGSRGLTGLLLGRLVLTGLILGGLLGGCARPPQDDLRLTPLPTLTLQSGRLRVTGEGPLRVTCDTPAGPVVHTLARAGQVPVPPGALACEASRPGHAEGRVTVALTPSPTAVSTTPSMTQNRAEPDVSAARGTLRVTPGTLRLGQREVWTVTADLRGPDGRVAPDGTPVTLSAASGAERLSAVRLTVNGVARWQLTPGAPGPFTFTARSGNWQGRAAAVAATGVLGGRPRAVFTGQVLTLGPLRWQDGALPDDGTPVRLRALTRAGTVVWSADVTVAAGQVRAKVPRVRGAVTLSAELAGSEVRFAWP